MFPSYVLANLFVKGSLKNTPTGFELKLKNIIDSGTLVGVGALSVDGESYLPEKISLTIKDRTVHGDQITSATPLSVYVLSEILITVDGATLSTGDHKLGFVLYTREAGRFDFTITEPLSE
jgi:hypothetical protein